MEFTFDLGKAFYKGKKVGDDHSMFLHPVKNAKALGDTIHPKDLPMFELDRISYIQKVLFPHPNVFYVHNVFAFDKVFLSTFGNRCLYFVVPYYASVPEIEALVLKALKGDREQVLFVRWMECLDSRGVSVSYKILPDRNFGMEVLVRKQLIDAFLRAN